MRILITGAAGFLGSHLVSALAKQGYELVGLDNLRRGRIAAVQSHIDSGLLEFVTGDVRDEAQIGAVVRGVDVVFHFAAQSNVMGSVSDPDYSFTTNVVGTYNVLKAAASAGVSRVIFSSSREVYGDPASIPVAELAPLEPKNAYGASKAAGEMCCRTWQQASGMECTILRFANLYGPGDTDRVIPLWLDRAARGDDLVLYGGEQVLDFVWIDTAVAALLAAMAKPWTKPINIGSGQGTGLTDLAKRILEVTESKSRITHEPARSAEVSRFVANNERMRSLLGVQPLDDPLAGLGTLAKYLSRVQT